MYLEKDKFLRPPDITHNFTCRFPNLEVPCKSESFEASDFNSSKSNEHYTDYIFYVNGSLVYGKDMIQTLKDTYLPFTFEALFLPEVIIEDDIVKDNLIKIFEDISLYTHPNKYSNKFVNDIFDTAMQPLIDKYSTLPQVDLKTKSKVEPMNISEVRQFIKNLFNKDELTKMTNNNLEDASKAPYTTKFDFKSDDISSFKLSPLTTNNFNLVKPICKCDTVLTDNHHQISNCIIQDRLLKHMKVSTSLSFDQMKNYIYTSYKIERSHGIDLHDYSLDVISAKAALCGFIKTHSKTISKKNRKYIRLCRMLKKKEEVQELYSPEINKAEVIKGYSIYSANNRLKKLGSEETYPTPFCYDLPNEISHNLPPEQDFIDCYSHSDSSEPYYQGLRYPYKKDDTGIRSNGYKERGLNYIYHDNTKSFQKEIFGMIRNCKVQINNVNMSFINVEVDCSINLIPLFLSSNLQKIINPESLINILTKKSLSSKNSNKYLTKLDDVLLRIPNYIRSYISFVLFYSTDLKTMKLNLEQVSYLLPNNVNNVLSVYQDILRNLSYVNQDKTSSTRSNLNSYIINDLNDRDDMKSVKEPLSNLIALYYDEINLYNSLLTLLKNLLDNKLQEKPNINYKKSLPNWLYQQTAENPQNLNRMIEELSSFLGKLHHLLIQEDVNFKFNEQKSNLDLLCTYVDYEDFYDYFTSIHQQIIDIYKDENKNNFIKKSIWYSYKLKLGFLDTFNFFTCHLSNYNLENPSKSILKDRERHDDISFYLEEFVQLFHANIDRCEHLENLVNDFVKYDICQKVNSTRPRKDKLKPSDIESNQLILTQVNKQRYLAETFLLEVNRQINNSYIREFKLAFKDRFIEIKKRGKNNKEKYYKHAYVDLDADISQRLMMCSLRVSLDLDDFNNPNQLDENLLNKLGYDPKLGIYSQIYIYEDELDLLSIVTPDILDSNHYFDKIYLNELLPDSYIKIDNSLVKLHVSNDFEILYTNDQVCFLYHGGWQIFNRNYLDYFFNYNHGRNNLIIAGLNKKEYFPSMYFHYKLSLLDIEYNSKVKLAASWEGLCNSLGDNVHYHLHMKTIRLNPLMSKSGKYSLIDTLQDMVGLCKGPQLNLYAQPTIGIDFAHHPIIGTIDQLSYWDVFSSGHDKNHWNFDLIRLRNMYVQYRINKLSLDENNKQTKVRKLFKKLSTKLNSPSNFLDLCRNSELRYLVIKNKPELYKYFKCEGKYELGNKGLERIIMPEKDYKIHEYLDDEIQKYLNQLENWLESKESYFLLNSLYLLLRCEKANIIRNSSSHKAWWYAIGNLEESIGKYHKRVMQNITCDKELLKHQRSILKYKFTKSYMQENLRIPQFDIKKTPKGIMLEDNLIIKNDRLQQRSSIKEDKGVTEDYNNYETMFLLKNMEFDSKLDSYSSIEDKAATKSGYQGLMRNSDNSVHAMISTNVKEDFDTLFEFDFELDEFPREYINSQFDDHYENFKNLEKTKATHLLLHTRKLKVRENFKTFQDGSNLGMSWKNEKGSRDIILYNVKSKELTVNGIRQNIDYNDTNPYSKNQFNYYMYILKRFFDLDTNKVRNYQDTIFITKANPNNEDLYIRLYPKEKEQKIETRNFGIATIAIKNYITFAMLAVKKVTSYISGQMMTMDPDKRDKKIQSLSKKMIKGLYCLMADISGHNQSETINNMITLLREFELLYGIQVPIFLGTASLFSNSIIYYEDNRTSNIYISYNQRGSIEGWLGPFWTGQTEILLEYAISKICPNSDLEDILVYNDDMAAIIKSDIPADIVVLKLRYIFSLFGFTLKTSQTNVSADRVTMLKKTRIEGVYCGNSLKVFLVFGPGFSKDHYSDEQEIIGLSSEYTSLDDKTSIMWLHASLKYFYAMYFILNHSHKFWINLCKLNKDLKISECKPITILEKRRLVEERLKTLTYEYYLAVRDLTTDKTSELNLILRKKAFLSYLNSVNVNIALNELIRRCQFAELTEFFKKIEIIDYDIWSLFMIKTPIIETMSNYSLYKRRRTIFIQENNNLKRSSHPYFFTTLINWYEMLEPSYHDSIYKLAIYIFAQLPCSIGCMGLDTMLSNHVTGVTDTLLLKLSQLSFINNFIPESLENALLRWYTLNLTQIGHKNSSQLGLSNHDSPYQLNKRDLFKNIIGLKFKLERFGLQVPNYDQFTIHKDAIKYSELSNLSVAHSYSSSFGHELNYAISSKIKKCLRKWRSIMAPSSSLFIQNKEFKDYYIYLDYYESFDKHVDKLFKKSTKYHYYRLINFVNDCYITTIRSTLIDKYTSSSNLYNYHGNKLILLYQLNNLGVNYNFLPIYSYRKTQSGLVVFNESIEKIINNHGLLKSFSEGDILEYYDNVYDFTRDDKYQADLTEDLYLINLDNSVVINNLENQLAQISYAMDSQYLRENNRHSQKSLRLYELTGTNLLVSTNNVTNTKAVLDYKLSYIVSNKMIKNQLESMTSHNVYGTIIPDLETDQILNIEWNPPVMAKFEDSLLSQIKDFNTLEEKQLKLIIEVIHWFSQEVYKLTHDADKSLKVLKNFVSLFNSIISTYGPIDLDRLAIYGKGKTSGNIGHRMPNSGSKNQANASAHMDLNAYINLEGGMRLLNGIVKQNNNVNYQLMISFIRESILTEFIYVKDEKSNWIFDPNRNEYIIYFDATEDYKKIKSVELPFFELTNIPDIRSTINIGLTCDSYIKHLKESQSVLLRKKDKHRLLYEVLDIVDQKNDSNQLNMEVSKEMSCLVDILSYLKEDNVKEQEYLNYDILKDIINQHEEAHNLYKYIYVINSYLNGYEMNHLYSYSIHQDRMHDISYTLFKSLGGDVSLLLSKYNNLLTDDYDSLRMIYYCKNQLSTNSVLKDLNPLLGNLSDQVDDVIEFVRKLNYYDFNEIYNILMASLYTGKQEELLNYTVNIQKICEYFVIGLGQVLMLNRVKVSKSPNTYLNSLNHHLLLSLNKKNTSSKVTAVSMLIIVYTVLYYLASKGKMKSLSDKFYIKLKEKPIPLKDGLEKMEELRNLVNNDILYTRYPLAYLNKLDFLKFKTFLDFNRGKVNIINEMIKDYSITNSNSSINALIFARTLKNYLTSQHIDDNEYKIADLTAGRGEIKLAAISEGLSIYSTNREDSFTAKYQYNEVEKEDKAFDITDKRSLSIYSDFDLYILDISYVKSTKKLHETVNWMIRYKKDFIIRINSINLNFSKLNSRFHYSYTKELWYITNDKFNIGYSYLFCQHDKGLNEFLNSSRLLTTLKAKYKTNDIYRNIKKLSKSEKLALQDLKDNYSRQLYFKKNYFTVTDILETLKKRKKKTNNEKDISNSIEQNTTSKLLEKINSNMVKSINHIDLIFNIEGLIQDYNTHFKSSNDPFLWTKIQAPTREIICTRQLSEQDLSQELLKYDVFMRIENLNILYDYKLLKSLKYTVFEKGTGEKDINAYFHNVESREFKNQAVSLNYPKECYILISLSIKSISNKGELHHDHNNNIFTPTVDVDCLLPEISNTIGITENKLEYVNEPPKEPLDKLASNIVEKRILNIRNKLHEKHGYMSQLIDYLLSFKIMIFSTKCQSDNSEFSKILYIEITNELQQPELVLILQSIFVITKWKEKVLLNTKGEPPQYEICLSNYSQKLFYSNIYLFLNRKISDTVQSTRYNYNWVILKYLFPNSDIIFNNIVTHQAQNLDNMYYLHSRRPIETNTDIPLNISSQITLFLINCQLGYIGKIGLQKLLTGTLKAIEFKNVIDSYSHEYVQSTTITSQLQFILKIFKQKLSNCQCSVINEEIKEKLSHLYETIYDNLLRYIRLTKDKDKQKSQIKYMTNSLLPCIKSVIESTMKIYESNFLRNISDIINIKFMYPEYFKKISDVNWKDHLSNFNSKLTLNLQNYLKSQLELVSPFMKSLADHDEDNLDDEWLLDKYDPWANFMKELSLDEDEIITILEDINLVEIQDTSELRYNLIIKKDQSVEELYPTMNEEVSKHNLNQNYINNILYESDLTRKEHLPTLIHEEILGILGSLPCIYALLNYCDGVISLFELKEDLEIFNDETCKSTIANFIMLLWEFYPDQEEKILNLINDLRILIDHKYITIIPYNYSDLLNNLNELQNDRNDRDYTIFVKTNNLNNYNSSNNNLIQTVELFSSINSDIDLKKLITVKLKDFLSLYSLSEEEKSLIDVNYYNWLIIQEVSKISKFGILKL